jgi:hypothetical protein
LKTTEDIRRPEEYSPEGEGKSEEKLFPLLVSPSFRSIYRASAASQFGCPQVKNSRDGWVYVTVTLQSFAEVVSTAGGVIALAAAASPSITSFSAWSTFSGLFDEVKCVGLRVQVVPESGAGTGAVIAMGSLLAGITTPGSISDVMDAPDAKLVSTACTTANGYIHVMKYPKTGISWATTSSPSPGPYAGCPGSIRIYGQNFNPTVKAIAMDVRATFTLRGRV